MFRTKMEKKSEDYTKPTSVPDLRKSNEEFDNFMCKVNDITKIISKLSSDDASLNEIGTLEADRYLKNNEPEIIINDDESGETIRLKEKFNRTTINKNILENDDPNVTSQAAFMKNMERDVACRTKDREIRKEKADTLKKRANKAFKEENYEKALRLYTEAISHLKDSCVLHLNQGLTYITLKLYEKALGSCDWALKLNENSLKAWLYIAKCHYFLGDDTKYQEAIKNAKERNPKHCDFIDEYIKEMESAAKTKTE